MVAKLAEHSEPRRLARDGHVDWNAIALHFVAHFHACWIVVLQEQQGFAAPSLDDGLCDQRRLDLIRHQLVLDDLLHKRFPGVEIGRWGHGRWGLVESGDGLKFDEIGSDALNDFPDSFDIHRLPLPLQPARNSARIALGDRHLDPNVGRGALEMLRCEAVAHH